MDSTTRSTIQTNQTNNSSSRLLKRLTNEHLAEIKTHMTHAIDYESFSNLFRSIFGHKVNFSTVFDEIDVEKSGTITWTQLLDYLLKNFRQNDEESLQLIVEDRLDTGTKREPTIKLLAIESTKSQKHSFCYVTIRHPNTCDIYDASFTHLWTYTIFLDEATVMRRDSTKKPKNNHVTDAIYCELSNTLMYATTCRSLAFYDTSRLRHACVWFVSGLPDVVTSMTFIKLSENSGTLLLGDQSGHVSFWNFLQPTIELFPRKTTHLSFYFHTELSRLTDHIRINRRRIHTDQITSIECTRETIITSSLDPEASVCVSSLRKTETFYRFAVPWGANCFAICGRSLATGGKDAIVRLWNCYVVRKPMALLKGHEASVVGLECGSGFLISLAVDMVVKTWSIDTYACLQTLKLNVFPSSTNQIIPNPIVIVPIDRITKKNQSKSDPIEQWSDAADLVPNIPPLDFPKHDDSIKSNESIILIACSTCVFKTVVTTPENFSLDFLSPPKTQNRELMPKSWQLIRTRAKKRTSNADVVMAVAGDVILPTIAIRNGSLLHRRLGQMDRMKSEMNEHIKSNAPYIALRIQQIPQIKQAIQKTRNLSNEKINR